MKTHDSFDSPDDILQPRHLLPEQGALSSENDSTLSTSPDSLIPSQTLPARLYISPGTSAGALPVFDADLFPRLPEFIRRILTVADTDEERDMLLLGSLVTLSAGLTKIYGLYDGKKLWPNLYLFISAPASAGKGKLDLCRQLVMPIHEELCEQARLARKEYEAAMEAYKEEKKEDPWAEKPEEPLDTKFILPANNSSTGIFQQLSDSEGRGLIFETEGDTLARAFRSQLGDYSDGLRKAFHHETISYFRRTRHEYVEIRRPCLSAVLSGTPRQIPGIIDSTENGLFSRFIFYTMNVRPDWKNVFGGNANAGLEEHFDQLGKEFYDFFHLLSAGEERLFNLTPQQQEKFNTFFAQMQDLYLALEGTDFVATIRRLGVIAFRFAMILTTFRLAGADSIPGELNCSDEDLSTALGMASTLAQHANKVFADFPKVVEAPKQKNARTRFLESLPETFTCKEYQDIANTLLISKKTAERYISEFVKNNWLQRDHRDLYKNCIGKPS